MANLDVSLAQTYQIAPFSNCHRSVRLPGATAEEFGLNVDFFPPRKSYDRIIIIHELSRPVGAQPPLLICSSFSRKLMAIRCLFAHQQAQPSRTYVPNENGKYFHDKYINKPVACMIWNHHSCQSFKYEMFSKNSGDEPFLEKKTQQKTGGATIALLL